MGANSSTDQLLFGIIALQNSMISREQLVSAFDNWVRNKSDSLPQILVKQGWLALDDCQALQVLVAHVLKKHEGDATSSLAAVGSTIDIRQELERIADPDSVGKSGLRTVGNRCGSLRNQPEAGCRDGWPVPDSAPPCERRTRPGFYCTRPGIES